MELFFDFLVRHRVFFTTELTKQLTAMDRYDLRVLSCRKFAIRELDTLRRQPAA